jgi:hypothetical protein
VQTVKIGQAIAVLSRDSARAQAWRRLKAARLLAGNVSLRDAALATGLAFPHLRAVERGEHPLLDTDALALGELLKVPPRWLRHGWHDHAAPLPRGGQDG